MKRLLALSTTALLAGCLLLAGCGKGNFSARTQGDPDTFRFPLQVNGSTLDPGLIQDSYASETLNNVYEGLVRYNEQNVLEPALAEKWEVTDGGKTFTFHLRHGVKFHNGRELKADDFKWAIDRNTNPKFNSPTASTYLNDIVGYAARAAGKSETVSGVTVLDPYTLKIQIDAPKAYFIDKLTYPCSFPLAKETMTDTEIRTPAQAVGTGPFKVSEYISDQRITLVATDNYWGPKPKIKTIVRDVIKDATVRVNKFRGGELDSVPLDRRDIKMAQSDPALKPFFKLFPLPSVSYIAMNGSVYKPFANRDVRRAVAMAIDRDKIDNVLLPGLPVAKQILPPGIPGHDDSYVGIAYDTAAAKATLAKAGYPDGKGLPPLELDYLEQTPESRITCEEVATELKENLGMQVTLRGMEIRTFQDAQNKQQLGFFMYGWLADYLDPQDFLSLLLTTGSSSNFMKYSNPEFDKICAAADVEPDEAKRLAMYRKAEDIAIQDVAWIPMYVQIQPYLISARTKGFRYNAFGAMPQLLTDLK
jgi:ABC-type transport system substrate-binding protein